jgi:DNA repair exonuclease SbcCD ATPase subunit
MNIVKKIGLSNVGPFKTGTVLNIPKGISFLYGKNLTGKSPGSANAAGKSLFASALVEIFYDSPVVGLKEDKVKAGHRFIEYQRGKDLIRVSSKYTNKEQLSIKVNGEEVKSRTKTITRDLLKAYWPLTESEFTTYGYLDSRVPHPLARGSTLDRKAFFTSFFGLDKIDQERKVFQTHLFRVKKVKAAFIELKSTYALLKKDLLDKAEVEVLDRQYEELRKKQTLLKSKFAEWQEYKRLTSFLEYAGPKLQAFYKLVPTLSEFNSVLSTVKKQLAEAEKVEEQMEAYKAYRKSKAVYAERTKDLDMSICIEDLESIEDKYQRAISVTKTKPVQPLKVKASKKPEADYKEILVEQARLEHELEHASKFSDGKCYTCGQVVKKSDIKVVRSRLKEVNQLIAEFEQWKLSQAKIQQWEKQEEEYQLNLSRYKKAKDYLVNNKDNHDAYLIRVSLPTIKKVEKPDYADSIKKITEDLDLLNFFKPHLETIKLCKTRPTTVEEFDMDLMDKSSERLSKIDVKLKTHRAVVSRVKEVRARLTELQADVKKEEALLLLVQAYGDKGIKRMAIEAISQHLMALVNKYASLVFEDYSFEFVWGTKIQILVHRPNEASIDVRKLSGFESQMFTIILVLSLLAFVPKSKRLSLLILDEPTASFSAESTDLFHQFIPQLLKAIPSILIVTPKTDERMVGAAEFTVLRTVAGAKIVNGHPDSLTVNNES